MLYKHTVSDNKIVVQITILINYRKQFQQTQIKYAVYLRAALILQRLQTTT
jgi:hypothetical protein